MSKFSIQYANFNGEFFSEFLFAFNEEQAKNRLLLSLVSAKIIKITKV